MSAAPSYGSQGLSHRLVRTLTRAGTSAEASAAVLAEIAGTIGAALGTLWMLDPRTGLLRWHTDWGEDPSVDALRQTNARLTFAPGVGLPGRVLETVKAAWVKDIAADENFPRVDVALEAGLRSVIGAPLVSADGPIGVIEFFRRAPKGPTAGEVELVGLAGEHLGAFLTRLAVEERLRATQEDSASIVQAALDCIVTMDHRGRIVDFNPAAEATFGYERDDVVGERLAEVIIPPELRAAHEQALDRYLQMRIPTILGRRLELMAMRSDASLFPVELTVTRLGSRDPPVFAGFIRDLTNQRSVEDQLASLLEREQTARHRAEAAERATREVADALQRTLLPPRLPDITGLDLAAVYRPATSHALVGGDFYDVFKVGAGRWAVAIGDVCGKGPAAASVTGMLRYAIRHAAVREESPSKVLEIASEELLRETAGDFSSAVFATVDVRGPEPRLCIAVGGHPLPLRARPDGEVEAVGHYGALLGAVPDPHITSDAITLRPEESLLLYTDGLTEAPVAGGRFGEERLRDVLARHARSDAQRIVDAIDIALTSASTGAAKDDVAILCIRATTRG